MADFSLEDVFGSTPQSAPAGASKGEMSLEDVFGSAQPTSATVQASQAPQAPAAMSVADVYNPQAPIEAGPTPSVIDYGAEFGKGVGVGLTTTASTALKGVAGWQAQRPEYPQGQSPLDQAMRGEDQAFETYNQGPSGPPLPTKEHPLYQAGQTVEDVANRIFPAGEGFDGSWTRDIGSGFGSVGGAIALSVVNPAVAGLSFVASGAGEATDNALKAGATPDQIALAARFGTIAGATDVVDALLPTLGAPGKVAGLIGKVGSKILIGALVEGGQEGLQQLIQNLIAKGIYKPDQDLMEDVPRSALIGMIVGGAAKPILDRSEGKNTKPATPAETNAAYSTLVTNPTPQPAPFDETKLPEVQAPPGPTIQPVPTDEVATQQIATSGVTQTAGPAAAISPIEQLLTQPPATPTEAFIRDKAPFSPDSADVKAQAAVLAGANNEQLPLTKKRLELMPESEMNAEDVLASADVRASVNKLPGVNISKDEGNLSGEPPANFLDLFPEGPRHELKITDKPPNPEFYSVTVKKKKTELKIVPPTDIRASVSNPGEEYTPKTEFEKDMESFAKKNNLPPLTLTRAITNIQGRIRQIEYDRRLTGRPQGEPYPYHGELSQLRKRLKELRSSLGYVDPNTRYNLGKLTPQAAQQRTELEDQVLRAFQQFHQEQQNRKIVLAAVTQVAGPKAAARTQTPGKIPLAPSVRENVKGWGDTENLPDSSAGFYVPSAERNMALPLIAVSVSGTTERSLVTAYHESWHAIEGTLTPDEVRTLQAETEPLRQFISEKNPNDADLYAQAEPEEIWAEAAGFYSYAQTMERTKIYNGPASYVFDKIQALLVRIKQIVRSLGFEKSGDIFQSFYNGEMASRREGLPGDMLERWWAQEAGYSDGMEASASRLESNTSKNETALSKIDPGIVHAPAQLDTLVLHDGVRKLFTMTHGAMPPQVQQALAHADVMSKRHKWMWGLDRLVDLNKRFTPLLRYAERIREMRTDAAKIQDKALSIAKDWRRLGSQMDNLGQLLDHITNMNYRTPVEVQNGVARHPTAAEFQAAVAQFGVSNKALQVFQRQKKFFEAFLKLTTQNAIAEAQRTISDPVALMNKIVAIQTKEAQLLSRPYFPFIRFGLHYVTVKDLTNQTVFFQTYESKGLRSAENVQQTAFKKIQAAIPAGHTASFGKLPESAAPFIGLPPELLESVQRDLMNMPNVQGNAPGLTRDQVNAIEQLRYAVAPASSFAHRFQNKDYTPGYSDDFLRAFSRYAFQGARYYSRVKYGWALRGEIKNAHDMGKVASDNKIGSIANYMDDHLYNTVLDTKGDFGWFKGGIFLWVFGYSVAGATLNLSQVPMVTYPWLAAKFGGIGFGDARAAKALARAGTQIENFYKKGSYANQTAFELKALDYGVKTGRISESQASELAGLAQGNTLLGQGNDKFRRGAQALLEKGTWFFEMAEQYNRRVTFRAALELAQKHPTSKAVQEAMAKYADEYSQLLQSTTFNPSEARSVVTAIHATEQTQFVYARENRPRFMRGRLAGSILVFKTYLLNVLQLMGANKGSVMPRQLLMLLAMGGIMGLPGADDLDDIANLLGKWMFGKNFNVQRQLREWLVELTGDKADVMLHGLARRGFGIPALLDMLGEKPSRGLGSGHSNNVPYPVLDRSKAVSAGRIMPFDLGSILDPTDVDKAIARETQNASGAVFGVGFNLYRAIMDESTSKGDLKRWERAMPRAVASASRAYRAYSEGRERGKGGPEGAATIVPYDMRDTEQAAEVIAMGLGYTPLRQAAKWDLIMAQSEAEKRLQIEQQLILQNRFEANSGGRPEEIDKANQAIRDYNDGLPDWARGYKISADTLIRSMEQRERQKIAREAGIPMQRRNKPVADYIQSLFPEAVVDVRKVD